VTLALVPGHRDEPSRQGGRLPDASEVLDQAKPDRLRDVLNVGRGQPVVSDDHDHEPLVPQHELIPRVRVAVGAVVDERRDVAGVLPFHGILPSPGDPTAVVPVKNVRRRGLVQ
jgi:hypothetical protein